MPVPTSDFDLFTSFRYDPKLLTSQFNTQVNGIELPYLLFAYHFERLVAAANYFGWRSAVAHLKATGASERLRHMCDQAVMDCVLTDKEKGLGVSIAILFVRRVCLLTDASLRAVCWSSCASFSLDREISV